jgi:hypothetical protein
MRKLLLSLGIITLMVSCGDEPSPPKPSEHEGIVVVGQITSDVTWHSDSIYTLIGRVSVVDGVTLTIEPGCIVKGAPGSGANASALVIARGGKIMAIGTPGAPIIFTSSADSIQPGQITSPNLSFDNTGLWGGIIVLGNAPISASASPLQIEGIPSSDHNGLYGGSDVHDYSGVMKYISIRHGGTNIGQGNEINGLTLGGVGFPTVIENIEIVANQDDGIELFGGYVDVTNVLVWGQQDDGIDIDQAYQGVISNFVVICEDQSDHALEIDGPEGLSTGSFSMEYGTLYSSRDTAQCHFRDGAEGYISMSGMFNIEADAGTNVVVDTLVIGADETAFDWTMAYAEGKL